MRRSGAPAIQAVVGPRTYPVHLGPGLVDQVGPIWRTHVHGGTVLLAYDGNVAEAAGRVGTSLERAGLRVVPAPIRPGESSKSLSEVERLTRLAAREGLRRQDGVVAVGGGVVGDLAGFVAASYQRGVHLAHVPTTLLAMVDSSIGGKTGVDLPEGKNYVGAVWQPDMVLMDTDLLATLPPRELSSGFAEVVKYGLLSGEDLFRTVEEWPQLPGPPNELADLILRCVAHKLGVVAEDERDLGGMRASLNLGHTIGHGIEAALGYSGVTHGEAISVGMMVALRLSERICGLDPRWRPRTAAVLERNGLPVRMPGRVDVDEVLAAAGRDKKSDGVSLNMVLIEAPGVVRLNVHPPAEVLRAAVDEVLTEAAA